ncbi:arsenite efflux transporter metallochaperone ArsD [Cryobacterium luteum]|uniref:Arsenite efflux transporter metallochaperone ArsD n=1 Tax=Cryobacterium luteum TaxID=1424661 RepID=A0A1H8GCR1_9MICO|nr:arsenite efflux transporter metallochaperone ArsD [Cryobacterium luteum]TFB93928.1 arsenite efflux transporter metallochaperone ArsD [Cryobacterium luteum]SEN41287.1 arsenite-transporting ATPase [Cryobacterium luteum]
MVAIRIYEPALCCDTGVCGVDVDQSLVEVTASVRSLQEQGADIQRHNLATDPLAFTTDETVRAFMHVVGSTGLPLTVVDGVTVATGSYPSKAQLLAFAGLAAPAARVELGLTEKSESGCCGGATGCC